MSTPAQEAFAEGFASLLEDHGETWTFGSSSFAGVASVLKADDPRLAGSTDRHFEIQVSNDALPAVRPVRGEQVKRGRECYRVVRAIDVDSATGIATMLTVYAGTSPAITTQPVSLLLQAELADVSFTVVAIGTPSPTYQWKKGGVNITGATSATLALADISATDAASYTVVVTNSFGAVTSSAALLTLAPAP